jgi:hypothetical protein
MDTGRDKSTSAHQSKGGSKAGHGVISNPTYKYSGGLASKIISFIANILKVIERLLLRLLTGPDRAVITSNHQPRSTNSTQKERVDTDLTKQECEKRERAQTVARS